jgi:hypothetical protein
MTWLGITARHKCCELSTLQRWLLALSYRKLQTGLHTTMMGSKLAWMQGGAQAQWSSQIQDQCSNNAEGAAWCTCMDKEDRNLMVGISG